MKLSYNEFHISKKVRDLCSFDKGLFASSGNVVFANMKNVRKFQLLFNDYIKNVTNDENKKVSAGQLNAMGLIDEILHHVCMLYRRDKCPDFMKDIIAELNGQFTKEQIDSLLLDFMSEFPPVEVYQEKCTAQEFLERTALEPDTNTQRPNREQVLEEMILLHLANENPAFKPFTLLFNDEPLSKNPLYEKTWTSIQKFALKNPTFGPFNHDLINLLREPQLFAPDSLKGQLDYIQKYWDEFLGEWIKRILAGIDSISEEEKAMWHGFGGGDLPDMQPYSYENLMNEYERYSPDSDWMPKVILIAKTVLVWLDQLTKQYGYPITRLDQIPDAELDKLRDEGFTGLWLIGLWERSKASKRIKQICGNPEAAASAYSLYDYNIAWNIGGWEALQNLRTRLWQRGIRLASDMVPNHTGMDGDWVINRPDLFIQRRDNPFPQYTYNGENLSQDSRISLYLEDHYYSKNDCSVVFKRVDNQTGDTRYIYHGNDGTGLPWNDTAQIDFLNPAAREAVMQEILHVAHNFPIIRFDAAMVLAKKSIRRLWYPEPGHGGDIATRSETGLSTQQFNDAIPNEFWREVVDRVAKECPDTLLLAEAFWMMEGYFVRTLGMHRVYNSAFMNMLKKEENQKYRDTVKNTINFDPQILKRYVNFMNNPDEETAIAQFGDGDKYFGVCTLMVTMPGLPMFGHGQIEGFTEKYGMEYTKAYKDEKPSEYLVERHKREIFPLMKKRYLFANVENFLFYDLWENGHVNENVFAYSNGCGNERAMVFYNNKYERASGWIKQSVPYAVKTGSGEKDITLTTRSISEGLNLTAENDKYCIFQEHTSKLWYIRHSPEICEKGLFVSLNGFEYQVLLDIHQVADMPDHRYQILCDSLGGKGCENIEIAWQEIIYKELYAALHDYITKIVPELTTLAEKAVDDKNLTKKINAIITENKDELTAFFTTALKFINDDDKVVSAEIQAKTVSARLNQIFKAYISSGKLKKTNAVSANRLLKAKDGIDFASILFAEESGTNTFTSLLLWALTGTFAENALAERWNLGRKLSEFYFEVSNGENNTESQNATPTYVIAERKAAFRRELTKLFILASLSGTEFTANEAKVKAYNIVRLLTQSEYSSLLSGANTFDGVRWFNKELCESSLNLIFAMMLISAKAGSLEKITALYKTVCSAKLKAAYKCELFIKPFAPVHKKAVKTAKPSKTEKEAKASKTGKTAAKAKSSKKAKPAESVKKETATEKKSGKKS